MSQLRNEQEDIIMSSFTHKRKSIHKTKPSGTDRHGHMFHNQYREARSILHLKHAIENQAAQRLPTADAKEPASRPATTEPSFFTLAFSRMPADPETPGMKEIVGSANDKYEQEAEHVADQVMRMPQNDTAPPEEEVEEESRSAPDFQRSAGEGAVNSAPPVVAKALASSGSPAPLSPVVKRGVEMVLGTPLPPIGVHSDKSARQAAASIHARAFTHGKQIFLGAGQDRNDIRLMAHEAVHVAQQAGRGRNRSGLNRDGRDAGSIQRASTPGEQAVNHFWKQLKQQTNLKLVVDKLKSAAKEIAKSKALEFHRSRTPALVEEAATILNLDATAKSALVTEWEGYLSNPGTFTKANIILRKAEKPP